MFLGFRSLLSRRPTLLIIRSIVGGHDRSYDRSFMTTTSCTIFSNRCWSRDHAYDQSYDDLPPGRKTDRSMRPLLAIVANIADRSHVRQIATDRTIKQSYDPVWQWLYTAYRGLFIGTSPSDINVCLRVQGPRLAVFVRWPSYDEFC